jgi:hypothetical protein
MPSDEIPPELQASDPLTETWSPQLALHVVGRYAVRSYNEHGFPKPQPFEVVCQICQVKNEPGAHWASLCTSGQVRSHIVSFATRHLHRDPLQAPRIERPGNFRRSRLEY